MATILSSRALNRQAMRGGLTPAKSDGSTTTTTTPPAAPKGGQRGSAPSASEYKPRKSAPTSTTSTTTTTVPRSTTTTVPKQTGLTQEEINKIVADAFKTTDNQQNIINIDDDTGGGGSGTKAAAWARLEWDKAKAQAEIDYNKAQRKYYEDLIKTGKYKEPYTAVRTLLGTQQTEAETAAKKPYADALARLKTAYETSKSTLFTGTPATATAARVPGTYEALQNFITANPLAAYASMKAPTSAPIENALAAYQRAQGVSSAPTDAAVEAMRVAASGGAGAFQNLLTNLQAAESFQQSQRELGARQAETTARTALERQYLTGQTGLTTAEAAALANIAGQYRTALGNVQTQEAQRLVELNDLIAKLAGYK